MNTLRTLLFILTAVVYPISNLSAAFQIGSFTFGDGTAIEKTTEVTPTPNIEEIATKVAETTQATDVSNAASKIATQEQGRVLRTCEEIKGFLTNFKEAHPYVLGATAIVITATGAYILYKVGAPAFVAAKTAQAIAYLKANYKKVVAYSGITAVLGGLSAFAYKNGYVSAGLRTASSWLSKMPAMPKPSLASFKFAKTSEFLTGKSAMVTAGILGAGLLTAGAICGYNKYKALKEADKIEQKYDLSGYFDERFGISEEAARRAQEEEAARREQQEEAARRAQEEAARVKAEADRRAQETQIPASTVKENTDKIVAAASGQDHRALTRLLQNPKVQLTAQQKELIEQFLNGKVTSKALKAALK